MARLVGLELGGTNAILVLGDGTEIEQRIKLPVTDAPTTLALVAQQIGTWKRAQPIDALGIASFGPVGIRPGRQDYGHILQTPKPGWAGADLVGTLGALIDGPVTIHTDVTAAALAEGRWGAAQGCADHVYITVGTGIGIGIIAGRQPVVGQMHPEGGHMRVRRKRDDAFDGCCPFHGDCLEGLASGPAIAARTGLSGSEIEDDSHAWESVIDALAEACSTLFLTLSSNLIILGGGVINSRTWLVEKIATQCAGKLKNYLPFVADRAPIHAAKLADNAGPRGALLLAEQCLSDRS